MKIDNDFKDLLQDGNSRKSKPMLIALWIVIVIIIAVSWSVFAYLNQSSNDGGMYKPSTSEIVEDGGTTADPQSNSDTPETVDTPSSSTGS